MSDFERENRYVVFKISDVEKLNPIEKKALLNIGQSIDEIRQARGKTGFEAVVIESDWPEYEPVWDMLQDRMTGVEKTPNPEHAKQSMHGECLATIETYWSPDAGWQYSLKLNKKFDSDKFCEEFESKGKVNLYTHAPDSAARIAELEKQLEEARKDAERYRCIKRAILRQRGGQYAFATYMGWIGSTFERGFDEAIDAAIRQIGGDASLNIKGGAE